MEPTLTPDILEAQQGIPDSATQENQGEPEVELEEKSEEQPSESTTSADGVQEKEATPATPYTDEEVTSILELEGKLDASRLTPTQKLIQKSFDRHYQKGYEANAAEKRELQRQAQELAQAKAVLQSQTAPPKTWEEAFTRDRAGTLQQVDQAIEQKFRDFENAEAYQLMRLRESLIANETQKVASAQQMNHYIESMSNRANVEVLKDIPDFQNKVSALDKFAIEDGIDQRVLQMITNAPVLDALLKGADITDIDGVQAVKQLVKFVNKQYERKTAAQSAETKKNIPSPKPLISAGTRSGSSSESKDLGRLNYPEYKKARAGA